jgi:tetratricopeptide (TPR) repeat protein
MDYFLAGRYDQAIEQERKTLDLDPNFILAHDTIGDAYVQKSMFTEGIAEFKKSLAVIPDDPVTLSLLGRSYALQGRRADAEKVLDQIDELSKREYVSPFIRAVIYGALGEKDKAFEWLDKSLDEHFVTHIKTNPDFDPLRSDPRFADLLRRMNLTP